jgi:RimJ/RimL family protein N-acetyltransferase
MLSPADNVVLTFPPRPLSQWERAQLAEWHAAARLRAPDIGRTFISERRTDHPRIAGRIVVTLRSSQDPAYLVHSPTGLTFWVVAAAPDWDTLLRFRTLLDALNFIRPVLTTDAR